MTEQPLAVGDPVRDTALKRVGVVMGNLGGYLQLRPLLGGREWDARPEHVQAISQAELLSARVGAVNERSVEGPFAARSPLASVDWILSEERHRNTPQTVYEMQCRTCRAASAGEPDGSSGRCWAMVHAGDNPEHRQYVQLARTFWRATPGPSNPERKVNHP